MQRHKLYAYNAKDWGGHTYYGPQGQKKVIDYIIGPRSMLGQIKYCATLGRMGR